VNDLFDDEDRRAILDRIDRLTPASPRQWGRMEVAQMMAHCAFPLEQAVAGRARQRLIGRILGPLARRKVLGEEPFGRNSPTDPDYRVADPRDFAVEKTRLLAAIDAFVQCGRAQIARSVHPFFGRLSGGDWGWLMFKHLDHHLRQFGA
jgi:hypothetical protein